MRQEATNAFPMDVDDPSSRPWKFRPRGYLVAVVMNDEVALRAEAALVRRGFAQRDIKRYTGAQILENQVEYERRRTVTGKIVASVIEDVAGRELYLAYARAGRAALWIRLPDEADAPKALRVLADHGCLHTRYYGAGDETDYHVAEP
jgi:hypothetical protein